MRLKREDRFIHSFPRPSIECSSKSREAIQARLNSFSWRRLCDCYRYYIVLTFTNGFISQGMLTSTVGSSGPGSGSVVADSTAAACSSSSVTAAILLCFGFIAN
jgi:hypothetical protein